MLPVLSDEDFGGFSVAKAFEIDERFEKIFGADGRMRSNDG